MRALTVCLVCLTAANLFAQDTPSPATEVTVYDVADLVALPAVKQSSAHQSANHEEWSEEHPQTIESLNKLAKLIETMVPADTGAVAAHEDSLSLVIRHTADGHAQIARLLDQLREQERPTIELTLVPAYPIFYSEDSLTAEQKTRVETLRGKQVLNEEETKEVLALLESAFVDPELEPFMKPMQVRLVNGRKTQVGSYMGAWATAATIVMPKGKDEFLIRIDFNAGEDTEGPTRQTDSGTVPSGCSTFFGTVADGAFYMCLAIPKRIEPEQKVTATTRETIR